MSASLIAAAASVVEAPIVHQGTNDVLSPPPSILTLASFSAYCEAQTTPAEKTRQGRARIANIIACTVFTLAAMGGVAVAYLLRDRGWKFIVYVGAGSLGAAGFATIAAYTLSQGPLFVRMEGQRGRHRVASLVNTQTGALYIDDTEWKTRAKSIGLFFKSLFFPIEIGFQSVVTLVRVIFGRIWAANTQEWRNETAASCSRLWKVIPAAVAEMGVSLYGAIAIWDEQSAYSCRELYGRIERWRVGDAFFDWSERRTFLGGRHYSARCPQPHGQLAVRARGTSVQDHLDRLATKTEDVRNARPSSPYISPWLQNGGQPIPPPVGMFPRTV